MNHFVVVSYKEAQELLPLFEKFSREAPYSEARKDARYIAEELKNVRDINYGPMRGKQIMLSTRQKEFFEDTTGIFLD